VAEWEKQQVRRNQAVEAGKKSAQVRLGTTVERPLNEPPSIFSPSSSSSSSSSIKEKEKEGKGAARLSAGPTQTIQDVLDAWNGLEGLPRCLLVSDKRRRWLGARLREKFFQDNWLAAMQRVKDSPFCRGENDRGWRATFDWFILPDSVPKVMEGKYDYRTPTTNGHAAPKSILEQEIDKQTRIIERTLPKYEPTVSDPAAKRHMQALRKAVDAGNLPGV
jgi:hypothetical protein